MKKSLFTFIRNDEDGQCTIATIIAENYDQALETCQKQFNPTAWFEVNETMWESFKHLNQGTILANNDDLKEV